MVTMRRRPFEGNRARVGPAAHMFVLRLRRPDEKEASLILYDDGARLVPVFQEKYGDAELF